MRPDLVVVHSPAFDDFPGVFQNGEPVEVQTVIAESTVEAFHECVLGRFAGLDKVELGACAL